MVSKPKSQRITYRDTRDEMATILGVPKAEMTRKLYWRARLLLYLEHHKTLILRLRINLAENHAISQYMEAYDLASPATLFKKFLAGTLDSSSLPRKIYNSDIGLNLDNKKINFLMQYWECRGLQELGPKLIDYAYDKVKLDLFQARKV